MLRHDRGGLPRLLMDCVVRVVSGKMNALDETRAWSAGAVPGGRAEGGGDRLLPLLCASPVAVLDEVNELIEG